MKKSLVLAAVLGLLAACAPGGVTESGDLNYTGPIELAIGRGETLTGTGIQYVANTAEGAQVSVDGQTSVKRMGDSLVWEAELREGLRVEVSTRVLIISDDSLRAAGTISLWVADPAPQAGPAETTAPIRYKVPVAYNVDRGRAIPGSTITYQGMSGEEAQLGNMEGDPTRQPGEAIEWEGQLSEGVWNRLELRTVLYTENSLNVVGTAELFIRP